MTGSTTDRPHRLGLLDWIRLCGRRLIGVKSTLEGRFLPRESASCLLAKTGIDLKTLCPEPAANHSYACALGAVSATRMAEQIDAFANYVRSVVFEMRVETDFRRSTVSVHASALQYLVHWAASLSQGEVAEHLQCLPSGAGILDWLRHFTMYVKSVHSKLLAVQRKRPSPSAAEIKTLITVRIPSSLEWLFHSNIIPAQSRAASSIKARLLDDLALNAEAIRQRCLHRRPTADAEHQTS